MMPGNYYVVSCYFPDKYIVRLLVTVVLQRTFKRLNAHLCNVCTDIGENKGGEWLGKS